MPYDPNFPPILRSFTPIGDIYEDSGPRLWSYKSEVDGTATITNPGYFSNARLLKMLECDIILAADAANIASMSYVAGFIGSAAYLLPLAGGATSSSGGGDEVTTQNFISSGTTAPTAILNSFNGWSSPDTGAKTQPIPISTGSLSIIEIADLAGTADLYPITAVPASGSIVGTGQDQVYEKFGSIRLRDTNAGWVNV